MLSKRSAEGSRSFVRSRIIIIVATLLAMVAAVLCLKFVSFTNNIETMLPRQKEITRTLRFFQDSNLSDKIVLSFSLKDSAHTLDQLMADVDRVLSNIQSPWIKKVTTGVGRESDMMGEVLKFSEYVPQLVSEEDLASIERRITPESIQNILKADYRTLLSPAGMFASSFIRSDPLGIKAGVLKKLQQGKTGSGYHIEIKNGHFVSRDGAHVMAIVETSVMMMDGFKARQLLHDLETALKKMPNYIAVSMVGGHLHTVSNEEVIKRDILVTFTVVTIVFALLFLFFLNDLQAGLFFILPYVSMTIVTPLCALFFAKVSSIVLGVGAVVAGIAVDYGIYVYVVLRSNSGDRLALQKIMRPLLGCALTTIAAFAAFFFSTVEGYHQLAFFSIANIVFCLLYAVWGLPRLFDFTRKPSSIAPSARRFFSNWKIPHAIRIWVWVVLLIGCAILIPRVSFKNDISQMDGTRKDILKAEEAFERIWSDGHPTAMFVAQGKEFEGTFERYEQSYLKAVSKIGKQNVSSFADVWPSQKTRTINANRWSKFWKNGQEEKLRKLLVENSSRYGFAEDVFDPFFKSLYVSNLKLGRPSILDLFMKQYVRKNDAGYQMLFYFPDEDRAVRMMRDMSSNEPGSFVVSRKNFIMTLSESLTSEAVVWALIVLIATPILTFYPLRNVRLVMLALMPVVTSIIVTFGTLTLLGLPVNIPILIACLVLVGLVVDYGIIVVYECHNPSKTEINWAVSLCAWTAIGGAGALVFAQHPILFSIGITLTVGVLSGYFSALWVIPSLYQLWFKKIHKSS